MYYRRRNGFIWADSTNTSLLRCCLSDFMYVQKIRHYFLSSTAFARCIRDGEIDDIADSYGPRGNSRGVFTSNATLHIWYFSMVMSHRRGSISTYAIDEETGDMDGFDHYLRFEAVLTGLHARAENLTTRTLFQAGFSWRMSLKRPGYFYFFALKPC